MHKTEKTKNVSKPTSDCDLEFRDIKIPGVQVYKLISIQLLIHLFGFSTYMSIYMSPFKR